MTQTTIQRCDWIQGKPDYYVEYHDKVWGVAEHDDQKLYQWLILESFHVGLSWQLVLSKKEAFMEAFDHFDYHKVARYDEAKVEELAQNEGIIRHRGKIKAAISNAQSFIKVREEFTTFDQYIWGFVGGEAVVKTSNEHLTQSELSDKVTKDMKKRGFKFIGSVTIYSYLQAIGIINDHDLHCEFR